RENPALQLLANLTFCASDDDNILAYVKRDPNMAGGVLVVVNLDPHAPHEALIDLPLHALALDSNHEFALDELFSGAHQVWRGAHPRLRLDPTAQPALVYRVSRHG